MSYFFKLKLLPDIMIELKLHDKPISYDGSPMGRYTLLGFHRVEPQVLINGLDKGTLQDTIYRIRCIKAMTTSQLVESAHNSDCVDVLTDMGFAREQIQNYDVFLGRVLKVLEGKEFF